MPKVQNSKGRVCSKGPCFCKGAVFLAKPSTDLKMRVPKAPGIYIYVSPDMHVHYSLRLSLPPKRLHSNGKPTESKPNLKQPEYIMVAGNHTRESSMNR